MPADILSRYHRASAFRCWNFAQLVRNTRPTILWQVDGQALGWREETPTGHVFRAMATASGVVYSPFDHERLAKLLSEATGVELDPRCLPFDCIEPIEVNVYGFESGGRYWVFNSTSRRLNSAGFSAAPGSRISPDRRWSIRRHGFDLALYCQNTGELRRLTFDGTEAQAYGTASGANCTPITDRLAQPSSPPVVLWAPDSRSFLATRLDERDVKLLHLVQSVPSDGTLRPVLHSYRYPMPGDSAVATAELFLVDVPSGAVRPVDIPPRLASYIHPFERGYAWWSSDSQAIFFLDFDRGHRTVRLLRIDAATGNSSVLVQETVASWYEPNSSMTARPNVRVLESTGEIVWPSERDGHAHLYLYDSKGVLLRQITAGSWMIRDLLHVDETKRELLIAASGRDGSDPYLRKIYRIAIDKDAMVLLTAEECEHIVEMPSGLSSGDKFRPCGISPRGDLFVETQCGLDRLPTTLLRSSLDGRVIGTLAEADGAALLRAGWTWPHPIRVTARDGQTELFGVLMFPEGCSAPASVPLVDLVYPGPQVHDVTRGLFMDDRSHFYYGNAAALCQLGFAVLLLDGFGTPNRSKSFHDRAFRNMQDAGGLADHVLAYHQIASQYPVIDSGRIGIVGYSGGGYMALRGVLDFPDVYRACFSAAGSYDQRIYVADWAEQYQGPWDPEIYARQALTPLVERLKASLMIVYGELDENVHPAAAMKLIDALIKNNRDFEMLSVPNVNHVFPLWSGYVLRRMWDFLVRNLLGECPPPQFKVPDNELFPASRKISQAPSPVVVQDAS